MISEFMTSEHRRCDDIFVQAENHAAKGDLESTSHYFKDFETQMNIHFEQEEQILFPAFESATGQTMGPTQVMRMEHQQMLTLFADMSQAITENRLKTYLGLSETFLVLMQQHNLKEEQMLYPMSDQALSGKGSTIVDSIKSHA